MNVANNKDCYGCGICAIACPLHIITMHHNEDGFYEPKVDLNKCINCGLCTSVCSFNDTRLYDIGSNKILSYASWSKNEENRSKSSSGGVVYSIARQLIDDGYKICAVKYNVDKRRAEHFIASSPEELEASIGSKYIQSYTLDGLTSINGSEKYVIIGTPCMIDSVRRLINIKRQEERFLLIDFFCHGVPSSILWNKYVDVQEASIGPIKEVSWRHSDKGWHDSLKMHLVADEIYNGGLSQNDIFYQLFLGDYCLGKACYKKCKFKMQNTSADIRVGDLWGKTYSKYKDGVSGVLLITEKGKEIFLSIQDLFSKEESIDVVMEGQMHKSPSCPLVRSYLLKIMKWGGSNFKKERFIIKIDTMLKKIVKLLFNPCVVIRNRFIK